MKKLATTSLKEITSFSPCITGYDDYKLHFQESTITFDRETCAKVIDELYWADVAWFIAKVRDEPHVYWFNKFRNSTAKRRKDVLYRAVNKSTLNDILMAFGL